MGICSTKRSGLVVAAINAAAGLARGCAKGLAWGLMLLVLAACSSQNFLSWEASDRSRPHYQVKQGDTLYSVAWGYNLDFRRLAMVNDLHPPYPIKPGQLLRLPKGSTVPVVRKPVATAAAKPSRSVPHSRPSRPTAKPATPSKPVVAATAPPSKPLKPTRSRPSQPAVVASTKGIQVPNKGRWGWPNSGGLLKNWGARNHQRSGLDISAKPGSAVAASAAGVVVYSGSGLARYGQLVILKHSEELLSAYAYNQEILVSKGQQVKAGEKIAFSGRSPQGVGVVHFEIRRRGKPVDAIGYLKRRG